MPCVWLTERGFQSGRTEHFASALLPFAEGKYRWVSVTSYWQVNQFMLEVDSSFSYQIFDDNASIPFEIGSGKLTQDSSQRSDIDDD